MALNNGNGEGGNKTFINLKLVATPGPTKDKPTLVKLDADFKETDETFTNVSGKLTGLKKTFTAAKGKMGDIYWFKAFIEDGEEVYVIESTITNASKDLLNSLIPNIGEQVKISLYLNKKEYPTASVRGVDDKFVKQALDFKDLDTVALYNAIPEGKKEEEIDVDNLPF